MHPILQKLMLMLFVRLFAFHKAKDAADPEERISKDEFVDNLLTDSNGLVTYADVYDDFVEGEVTVLDVDINFGRKWPIRMITQNPKKRDKKDKRRLSEYAKLARKGHDIVWILYRSERGKNIKCGPWLARIDNGVYTKLRGEGESFKLEAQKEVNSMVGYIRQIAGALPEVPFGNVAEVVSMAGQMGILK